MTEAFLGLGSNLGCKAGSIRRAAILLKSESSIENLELSSFYKTEPVGKTDQDWFVNAVVRVETDLPARALLEVCLAVERTLGRERVERWGPRTIDIDVLFWGQERVKEDGLELPHPRIAERAFVLRPLLDLRPEFSFRDAFYPDLLKEVDGQGIERMDPVVAILGASEKPDRYANMAQKLLLAKGHKVQPVAPRGDEVLGVPVVRCLTDCVNPVDTLTLYVGSARLPSLLPDMLRLSPRRVIFNPGTENEEVENALESAGIETIEACTLVMLRVGTF